MGVGNFANRKLYLHLYNIRYCVIVFEKSKWLPYYTCFSSFRHGIC